MASKCWFFPVVFFLIVDLSESSGTPTVKQTRQGGAEIAGGRGDGYNNGLTCYYCKDASSWAACTANFEECVGDDLACVTVVEETSSGQYKISSGCLHPAHCHDIFYIYCWSNMCDYCCLQESFCNHPGVWPAIDPGTCNIPGEKGDPGVMGYPGPVGPPGMAGFPGLTGQKGVQGPPSSISPMQPPPTPGQKGNKGAQGSPGFDGLMGVKGDSGQPGNIGHPGVPGDRGNKGYPGTPGVEGDHGESGDCSSCFQGGCDAECSGGLLVESGSTTVVFGGISESVSQISGDYNVISLDTMHSNTGGGYNEGQDVFIAPVTGYYYFSASAISEGNGAIPLALFHNGGIAMKSGRSETDAIGPYPMGELTWIQQLNSGDFVQLAAQPIDSDLWSTIVGSFRSPSMVYFEGHKINS